MTLINSHSQNRLINPVDSVISQINAFRKDAKRLNHPALFDLCTDMLDIIALFRADSDRLDKLNALHLIQTEDVRAWLDQQNIKD